MRTKEEIKALNDFINAWAKANDVPVWDVPLFRMGNDPDDIFKDRHMPKAPRLGQKWKD